jgi:hypothetical protein
MTISPPSAPPRCWGELAAAVEFRRRFRGITDNEVARDWARRIVAVSPPTKGLHRET